MSCLCSLLCAVSAGRAAEQVLLRFDRQAEPSPAALVTTQDAQLQWKDDRLGVTTGWQTSWPGITIRAPHDAWDLSSFANLAADLSNPSDQTITVSCRVDNPGADGRDHCLNGRLELSPGQTATLIIPLHQQMPEALRSKLFGMRGYPHLWGEQQGIDLHQVTQLLFFLHQPREQHQFELLEIRASGQRSADVPTVTQELFPLIDRFGQFRHTDWPGKTMTEADLDRQRISEQADLQAHPGPADWNSFGGWQPGPSLEATGRFRTLQYQGRWWFVDPDGRLFWSHGIDCVRATTGSTPISDREHWFADLPGTDSPFAAFYGRSRWAPHGYYQNKAEFQTYNFTAANLLRKYGENWQSEFARLCHERLRSWGMNTIANWSDTDICQLHKTPYTANVGFDSVKLAGSEGYWGKFPDVFDADFTERLRRGMAGHRGGAIGDRWCLGYFVSNELSWGDELSLAEATLASPPQQAAKQVFLQDLQEKYETIEALNQAWGTQHASWDALLQHTTAPDRQRAGEDLAAFYTKLAEQYFRSCRDVVKQFDPQGLYLGCRFAWANDRAVRAAAKYCDVISFNRYARTVADLRLPDGVDRPVVIGEFHFGALDRGMFHTGLVPVESQQQRAEAYKQYVFGALQHPAIVGTHWFQYSDQATTGRGDGENYQIGFLDICDTPYPETIAASRQVGHDLYRYRSESRGSAVATPAAANSLTD